MTSTTIRNGRESSAMLLLCAISIVALVLGAYWPGRMGGFIFDDYVNLVLDPDWKVTSLSLEQWIRAAFAGQSSELGRPLAMLSFAANHYFGGMDPIGYKTTNIVLHSLNAVLVFTLCRAVTSLTFGLSRNRQIAIPAVVAAIWSVHPLQVSTVLYVVQRMEIASQGAAVLSLILFVVARKRMIAGAASMHWLAASIACILVGFAFKENVLVTPALMFLIELVFLRFRASDARQRRRLIVTYTLLIALAGITYILVVMPYLTQPTLWESREYDWWQRLVSQPIVLGMYLHQIVWPYPESYLFYYDHLRAPETFFQSIWPAAAVLLHGAILAGAVAVRRSLPLVTFGIAWFYGCHLITSNVIPLELAFEHRNYLALLGPVLAIAGLAQLLRRWVTLPTGIGISLALMVAVSATTYSQSSTWGNPLTLASTLASRNPDSVRAQFGFASAAYDVSRGDPNSPMWALAFAEMQNAAALDHGPPLGEHGQIVMAAKAGRPVPAEVWVSLRSKLSSGPTTGDAIALVHSLVRCRVQESCALDDQQLYVTLLEATEANPKSTVIKMQYATFAFNVMRDSKLAIRLLDSAIALNPDDPALKIGKLKFQIVSRSVSISLAESEIDALENLNHAGRFDSDLLELRELIRKRQLSGNEEAAD